MSKIIQKTKFKQTEIGMIPEDWEVKPISSFASIKSGKRLPKGRDIVVNNTGFPYIRIRDLQNMSVNVTEVKFLEPDVQNIIKKYIITENDVYISIVGTIGLVGTIPRKLNNANLTENCARLTDLKVNRNYLKYFLNSKFGQNQIKSLTVGTTQGKLALSRIAKIIVAIPIDNEQSAIAKILSDLDTKIELNQQMNKTLESIGQAIFKHWFVDFEFPNEKGKPYKSSGGEMIDSELGKIPRRWKIGKIGGCMEFAYGKGLPETKRQEGSFPVLGSNGIIGFHSDYLIKGPGIVIGRKGTLGEVYWIENNFFPIDTTFYIVDKMKVGLLYFHYFVLKGKEFLKSSSDSAVPGLNRNSAYSQSIIIPSEAIISKFNVFCQYLFNKKNILSVQSNGLSQIRDSLLPRLMSGKIRVPVEVKI